jgi:hypothetical protein
MAPSSSSEGEVIAWESDKLGREQRAQFLQRVLEYETAPSTTHFQQLTEAGLQLQEPEAIADEQLASAVHELIVSLAQIRVFITLTNHLSDRELYNALWHDVLREEIPQLAVGPCAAWHVDLLCSGSETDTDVYLKYYADEDWRQQWLVTFPDCDMPARESPPYDRDRFLPQPDDPPFEVVPRM